MKRYSPELDIRKAHDVRRLEGCKCGGLGMREHMAKIGGHYYHGRCEREACAKIAHDTGARYTAEVIRARSKS